MTRPSVVPSAGFWAGKRVLITGHTGFKGAWLAAWLLADGAEVMGLSLAPDTDPSLYEQIGLRGRMAEAIADIRDVEATADVVSGFHPDVVFHLAAQSLVRRSYRDPLGTWGTNVMGSANLLAACSALDRPCAMVLVTTDKVYENREWLYPYRETDRLGGHDPYSASKAASEILIASWRASFLAGGPVRLASARAGNVIGGGDWAEDRILPDLVRARQAQRPLDVRNPDATRPWQHVLEPLSGYRLLAERLCTDPDPALEGAFNFGPDEAGQQPVRKLLEAAELHWPGGWTQTGAGGQPHEATLLALTIEKARKVLGWSPRWGFGRAVAETIGWYRAVHQGGDAAALVAEQIAAFEATA
ncbi:MAG: CDP-glucose 4,6-dehydratase [Tropicimonas sp.]|uniref:CDP-glucose 4,6-dehydratase n=1 Tax=Tropicimonas sp. TaxID=2067044 RepID=UPI003A8B6DF0